MRIKQWSKNLLVLSAPLFAGGGDHAKYVLPTLMAFFAMSLLSSSTYICNDLIDVERDRLHPVKQFRPLASGALSKSFGMVIGVICFVAGLIMAALLGKQSL